MRGAKFTAWQRGVAADGDGTTGSMIPLVAAPLGVLLLGLALGGRSLLASRLGTDSGVVIAVGLVLIVGSAVVAWQQGIAADETGTTGSLIPELICMMAGIALVLGGVVGQRRRNR